MKKTAKLLWLLPLVFVLAGCGVNVQTKTSTAVDVGGVFVSANKGDVWKSMSLTPSVSGTPGSISFLDVNQLVIDPQDSGAVYMATDDNGLYYTYNVAKGWTQITALPTATINDFSVDPKNKCALYAAIGNKLYKSVDCGRSFGEAYFDNNPSVQVSAVAIDHYDSNQVYLGTSRGDVLKSLDGGQSWRSIQKLDDGIRKILVSPEDSRVVFVATVKSGLYRFNSGIAKSLDELTEYKNKFDGSNWVDLNGELKEFDMGINFKGLVFVPADNSLFMATDKVLLKSLDNGQSWAKIKLVTPDNETNINAITINPKDAKEIYYVTNTTFYKSIDAGNTWIAKQLVTSRAGSTLAIDFDNPTILYLGAKKIKK
jgi:photosystem II stability/assembly factor-like uncharacterized protein